MGSGRDVRQKKTKLRVTVGGFFASKKKRGKGILAGCVDVLNLCFVVANFLYAKKMRKVLIFAKNFGNKTSDLRFLNRIVKVYGVQRAERVCVCVHMSGDTLFCSICFFFSFSLFLLRPTLPTPF